LAKIICSINNKAKKRNIDITVILRYTVCKWIKWYNFTAYCFLALLYQIQANSFECVQSFLKSSQKSYILLRSFNCSFKYGWLYQVISQASVPVTNYYFTYCHFFSSCPCYLHSCNNFCFNHNLFAIYNIT